MKIGNLPDALQPTGLAGTGKAARANGSDAQVATDTAVEGVDQVAISLTSRQLSGAGQGEISFDEQKVEALKKAIAEGTHKVDSGAIADKLIAHHADLFSAGKGSKP